MGVLLPGLHNLMNSIEFDYGTGFMLALLLVKLTEPLVQNPLLPQDHNLIVVHLEHLLLQVPLQE